MTNIKENQSRGEKNWILAVRILGFIIGFLPFIPNTLWYLGVSKNKTPIDYSDAVFIIVGFIFVWGSANFGSWANSLGKSFVDKIKK